VNERIAYGYDAHGRIVSQTHTINGIQYTLGFSFDAAGRQSGMTYPSGRTLSSPSMRSAV